MDHVTGNHNRGEVAIGGNAAFDASTLAERLRWEQQDYWMHLEATAPLEKYPAKQHARRVAEKLGVSEGFIYLAGEPTRNNEDSDMPAPYRQRRYFYYLSGCNEPDCHLAYNIQEDTLTLFIPRIDPTRVIWYGRGSTPGEAMDKYDIDKVLYIDCLADYVGDFVKFYNGPLYILHPSQNPLKSPFGAPVDTEALQPAMNLARVVKDDYEIRLIKKANDISSQAHKEVLANILKFKSEAQVEGLFLDVCISKKAKEQAYHPIAASGPNAGTLHYDANNEDFDDRVLMVLDAGCEVELYASDITRTFPLSGNWPSKESKAIYDLVHRMQETCIDRLKPGIRYLDLHILAHQIAIDGLLQLGIFHNGTREEIYKAGTSKAFFPHGLGHHVGLEVHDPGQGDLMSLQKGNPMYEMAPSLYPENFHLPVYDPKTCRSPVDVQSGHLEEGMVLTVEPGMQVASSSMPKKILIMYPATSQLGGVRIEDDILITSKSHENLTTAPKAEAMLEIIRSQNAQWPFVSDSADLGPVSRNIAVSRKSSEDDEESLLRAPGISQHTPEPILRPIQRASTAPVYRNTSVDFEPFNGPSLISGFKRASTAPIHPKKSVDFEQFNGPSLLSGFKRASTLDVTQLRGRSGQTSSRKTHDSNVRTPICGIPNPDFMHAYLDFPTQIGKAGAVSVRNYTAEKKPACQHCTVLTQTLGRLRQNLANQEHNSPKPLSPSRKNSIVEPGLSNQQKEVSPYQQNLNIPPVHCTYSARENYDTNLPSNIEALQPAIPITSILNPYTQRNGGRNDLPIRQQIIPSPGEISSRQRFHQRIQAEMLNKNIRTDTEELRTNMLRYDLGRDKGRSGLQEHHSPPKNNETAPSTLPTSGLACGYPSDIPPRVRANNFIPSLPGSNYPSFPPKYEHVCRECLSVGHQCKIQEPSRACDRCRATSQFCSLTICDGVTRKISGLQQPEPRIAARSSGVQAASPNPFPVSKTTESVADLGLKMKEIQLLREREVLEKKEKLRKLREARIAGQLKQWRQTVGVPEEKAAEPTQATFSETPNLAQINDPLDSRRRINYAAQNCSCRVPHPPLSLDEDEGGNEAGPGFNPLSRQGQLAKANQALATAQAKVQQLASTHGIALHDSTRPASLPQPLSGPHTLQQSQAPPQQQVYSRPYGGFIPPQPVFSNVDNPNALQNRSSSGQPITTETLENNDMKALRKAMDELWKVKQDMENHFGTTWNAGRGAGEGRREWGERVEGSVRRGLAGEGH
ncbi:hypothetical protein P154DRAFT_580595 [Amniculicola lignicola CBS 123094]|uniref:Xaa-Pro aminopeptidase n=1 Tax=Amniculicola lignicola CBS 123094 TaxID=1392246 RepID=A0A6A5W6K3_9PLEO|nr:hypothetical protein P154DRAFT_580595 [Amniculicola lignicola CBS 123094]